MTREQYPDDTEYPDLPPASVRHTKAAGKSGHAERHSFWAYGDWRKEDHREEFVLF